MKKSSLLSVVGTVALAFFASGCATSVDKIQRWERDGNVEALSSEAREKSEPPLLRKKSLESLARLNWKPTNQERLEVYETFGPKGGHQSAAQLMAIMSADQFSLIDSDVVDCSSQLNKDGSWNDSSKGRRLYDKLRAQNKKAVTLSLCQQTVARPELRTRVLLVAIKLGIPGSENDLNAVLLEYGDKSMAEDYLNCGSSELEEGGRKWGNAHGYSINTGPGSHRSGWGSF